MCRVISSTLVEDRRDAVRGIKALSKKYRAEVGRLCLGTLMSIIRDANGDTELIGYAVEALLNVFDGELGDGSSVAEFADALVKDPTNVSLLLGLLEEFDFQVRRYSTLLLTALLKNRLSEVQDGVLLSPMGVSRMMDLLQDSREVIRNDALLLLVELTKSNKQIQQIVTFESAFDRLFSIMREEGLSDGGIVVEDCIFIMANLLKGNNSNQSYFREASMIQQLVALFELNPDGTWPEQKVRNVYHSLNLVRIIVSPQNPPQANAQCQNIIRQCGLLELLCKFMFASGIPTEVLIMGITTVAEVIRGCNTNQQYFEKRESKSFTSVLALLMSMVRDKQPIGLRMAALYCFECFVYKNDLGQTEIINTLLPSSAVSNVSAGQVLCAGLFSKDPVSTWCTAIALSNCLSVAQKPHLLRVQLSMQGEGQVTLLQQCTNVLADNPQLEVQSRIGLLIFLCTWLSECSVAVQQFLDSPSNIPFLTGQILQHHSSKQEQLVDCLCALLMGTCLAYHDETSTQYTKATLLQIINHRIGQEAFSECLRHISSSEYFIRASQSPQPVAEMLEDLCFDHTFTQLFRKSEDAIKKALDPDVHQPMEGKNPEAPSTSIEDHDSIVSSYKELIRDQDQELTSLRAKHSELEQNYAQDRMLMQQQMQEIQTLKEQVSLYSALKPQGNEGEERSEVEALQSTILELQHKWDEQKAQLESKDGVILQLQEELEAAGDSKKLRDEICNLKAENEALLTEKEMLDKQLDALQKKPPSDEDDMLDGAVAELEQQFKNLQLEHGKLREAKEVQEKEQDDLLVLLANHDSKVKQYKALLLKNNIEFEASGESEEGSEEEEEDDEEL